MRLTHFSRWRTCLAVAASQLLPLILCDDADFHTIPLPSLDPCPQSCQGVSPGSGSSNWTAYPSTDALGACDDTILLDFVVNNPIDDPNTRNTVKACVAAAPPSNERSKRNIDSQLTRRAAQNTTDDDGGLNSTSMAAELLRWSGSSVSSGGDVDVAARSAVAELTNNAMLSIRFAQSGNQAIGIFAGASIKDSLLQSDLVSDFLSSLQSHDGSRTILAQICGENKASDSTFGIVAASGSSRFASVQSAVAAWNNGTCVEQGNGAQSLTLGTYHVHQTLPPTRVVSRDNFMPRGPSRVVARATCSTHVVVSGDTCYNIATNDCKVSLSQYQSYNPNLSCSNLQVGQWTCCSSGNLPTPTPNSAGTCATWKVASGDTCAAVATAHGISASAIPGWNTKTWGWNGCNDLQIGQLFCISKGNPPMPAALANAVCGPQVPGTATPSAGANISMLNPCPLNACCDIWGQCGTTSEFCTASGTGAPGTAKAGTNGCISNCGTDIVSSGPPASKMSIAYFEAWNPSRPCMQMDVSQVDSTQYTHLHLGFASISNGSYTVDITSDIEAQFKAFVSLKTSMKKILSIGGWTFSTAPYDYDIFRTGMTSAHRDAMASSVASFITSNNLDGVDFDWEYPGAPDIPGIPAGSKSDGANYLAFLQSLRSKLPSSKTISIAAPASFWYLQGFPIAQIAKTVNYIVFMTYDLHGQWDYGNKYSDPGCSTGNCLRSHVNLTETVNALSMITKAGVPSNQIAVGVASYGRSFQMTSPGCTGPMCTYTGPNSGAQPGPCTATAGYIANAELQALINVNNPGLQQWYDSASDSNMMVWAGTNWVAYMNSSVKASRTAKYLGLNFAGTSDWAVDLQKTYPPIGGNTTTPGGSQPDEAGTRQAISPILEDCSAGTDGSFNQQADLLEAWQDASKLAKLGYQWSPGGQWQNAMDLYLGTDSKNDFDFFGDPGPIGRNIWRQYFMHFAGWGDAPRYTYAWFYCDPSKVKGAQEICDKGAIAFSWDSLGWFWSAHYVVFCSAYWNSGISLSDITEKADGNQNFQQTLTNFYDVKASTVFHETYHWENTVSVPRAGDLAYPSQEVADLAYYKNSGTAYLNAESYADVAMSIYIMSTWGWTTPPTPNGGKYVPGSPPGATSYVDALDNPPTGWTSPVNNNASTFAYTPASNIVDMSTLGDVQSEGDTCAHGMLFINQQQCHELCASYYGDTSSCTKATNEDTGQTWWACTGCGNPTGCVIGTYDSWYDCRVSCDPQKGGTCNQQLGFKAVTCSGCTNVNVCKPGSYPDFDTCGDNCFEGACNESAGVPGVTCEDCPSS